MTTEERAMILVTARFLRAMDVLPWLAAGLTVVAAGRIAFGNGHVASAAAMAIGFIAIFYGVRVAFDAALLEDVNAERLTAAELDKALGKFGKGDRSWTERCRGAKRLAINAAVATLVQFCTLVLMGWS